MVFYAYTQIGGASMQEQWYSNKELFEMVQKLREELQQTRIDLRKYNDLRGAVAEVQRNQIEQSELFRKHLFEPEGLISSLKCEFTNFVNDFRKDLIAVNKRIEDYESQRKGKKAVAEGFIRWGGWIIGLLSFFITIYKLFV